jgi:transcriptional regulator with XRE-family HTH domain
MMTRQKLLRSSEYWFEEAQNELYRQVIEYKEQKGINQTQLAKELGVTKGYVSQILKGEFNYTLKKLIEICLAIGQVPRIEYTSISKVIEDDAKTEHIRLSTSRKNSRLRRTTAAKEKR